MVELISEHELSALAKLECGPEGEAVMSSDVVARKSTIVFSLMYL